NASMAFPTRGITIKEIFPCDNTIFRSFQNMDVAKAYSIFQYFEACLMIEEIIKSMHEENRIQIVLALPNDELKYYMDNNASLLQDLQFLMNVLYKKDSQQCAIDIRFLSFKFGENINERPYKVPGKTFKK